MLYFIFLCKMSVSFSVDKFKVNSAFDIKLVMNLFILVSHITVFPVTGEVHSVTPGPVT